MMGDVTVTPAEIDELVTAFFAAFASGPGCAERLDELPRLFLPKAIITNPPRIYDVDSFIAPRRALLLGDALRDFREWEVTGRTELAGDVAHRLSAYAKSWTQDGRRQTGRGTKSLQLVRTAEGWRIAALAWSDEVAAV
jgi:hypothetical protein